MSKSQRSTDADNEFLDNLKRRLKRWAVVIGVPLVGLLILFLILWNVFFKYVPPGKMLVVEAKFGEDRDPERTMSKPGEKGVQEDVLGEGWHFVTPIVYTTELKDNVKVEPGMVGIVTAKGGKTPKDGHVLTDNDDEKGIRRKVLPPGTYRLNPHGYAVEQVKAIEITPGHVGLQLRKLGEESSGRFAENEHQKGLLREVLQPGLYFINTREYTIKECEVGIYQTTYQHNTNKNSSLTFQSRDGFKITLECTIEWEIRPKDVPDLAARYPAHEDSDKPGTKGHNLTTRDGIESNVIHQQAKAICQTRGFNYGAEDFLEGDKREKFQADFTQALQTECEKQQVRVISAYIRNIIIPETVLKPKRDTRLAEETKITNEVKQELARSNADVEEEKRKVEQAVETVRKETEKLVAEIKIEVDNLDKKTTSEIEQITAKYQAQIADKEAQATIILAEADTNATKLKETAKSGIHKMKLDVFQGDGNAFQRYNLAEQLNPKLVLRLFHAGPGTFWTNLDCKSMNLMLTPPSQAESKTSKEEKEPGKKN